MRPTSRPLYLGPGPLQAQRSPSSRRRPRATVACPLGSYEEQQRIGGALEASARLGRQHHPPIKPIVCVPRLRFPRHFRRARTTSRNNDREQGSGCTQATAPCASALPVVPLAHPHRERRHRSTLRTGSPEASECGDAGGIRPKRRRPSDRSCREQDLSQRLEGTPNPTWRRPMEALEDQLFNARPRHVA